MTTDSVRVCVFVFVFVRAWPEMTSALDNKHALQPLHTQTHTHTGNDCNYKRITLLLWHLPDGL